MTEMIIGIHHTKGSFSERWIAYCEYAGISYKLVDCYSTDIIQQLSGCDALMWHFNHKSPKASKFAKQLLSSVPFSGKKVFPDFNTSYHFDDKVAQKYLLEAIGAPLAPANVFYTKAEALEWAKQITYPKVFKLRNGAGADNVRLVKTQKEAYRLINKSFNRGFKQYEGWNNLKERYRKYRLGKSTFLNVVKGIIRLVYTTDYARVTGKEIGYIYFQEFIPENSFDIRVIVVGNKAFAIKRMVRKNDFRASGSGFILYEKKHFDDETVQLAFNVSDKLKSQCMTYDFVYLGGKPLIVEISYGFSMEGYDDCSGYWDKGMTWYEGKFNPYGWMVEDLKRSIQENA
jgi:glutathione synthase/RimK-type ligase-like ATP-grasp enzyme